MSGVVGAAGFGEGEEGVEGGGGEVGKVGVPVAHLGHMRTLLDQIPPGQMNTSMTINATAAWLLALYVANAEEQGVASHELRGTTQNDIVKILVPRMVRKTQALTRISLPRAVSATSLALHWPVAELG